MKKSVKCNLCDKELSSQYYLNIHISGHHEGVRQIKCNLCDFETYMQGDLQRHMRNHTGERPFRCTVNGCTSTFKDSEVLSSHIKYKHSSERPLKCEFPRCLFTAKTSVALRSHIKVHSDDRPYACPNTGCNFRAKFRMHITQHVTSVHRKIKPFACSKCEFKSAQKRCLDYHMACHSTKRDFKCTHPTCKKAFKRPLDLKRHLSNRHGARNFHCHHHGCVQKFGSANLLYKHKLNCHSKKNFGCPECSFRTIHATHLARHRIVHEGRKDKISCSIEGCDYKAKNSEAVEMHMRRHKTLVACPENGCSQYIRTDKKLMDHAKLLNPSAGAFHCPLCFKHFRTLRHLQDHCVTHTKEKQFMCGYCDYATANHHQVKTHISSVHSYVQFPFIGHLMDIRECLHCKVILPSAQFLIHSMTHAVPVVIVKKLQIKCCR